MKLRKSNLTWTPSIGIAIMTLCISAAHAESISVDFAKQTATSSYLIFGGCSPNPAHAAAWDLLETAGVTCLRFDVKFGAYPDPKNLTLADYRANMGKAGTVADVNSKYWDWSRMDGGVALCRKHGFKSIGIICYSPKWLGYTNVMHSPPKDWEVWRDLVKQVVTRYRDKIDYWEIWNEPNGPKFLVNKDSPYPQTKDGMLAAYADICKETIVAVKESGIPARLGGPSLATWGATPFMDKFLAHTELTRDFDFLSYHIYFHCPKEQRLFPPTVAALEGKHGAPSLPLFITEWNCQSGVAEKYHPFKNTPESVGWVGKTFVLFLQWGVTGANYYNMRDGKKLDDGLAGAYDMVDGQPRLFRYIKVFHLLSTILGLGAKDGPIKVFDTRVEGLPDETQAEPLFVDSLYAVGCVNSAGAPVIVVANPSAKERQANIGISGLDGKDYHAKAYVVRPDHSPEEAIVATPLFDRAVPNAVAGAVAGGRGSVSFPVAAYSVVGIVLETSQPKER